MRITHVITRLIVGGAQENTVASVLGLARKPGFQVDLLSGPTIGREGSLESLFALAGAPALTLVPDLIRPVSPIHDVRAVLALKRIFHSQRPDVVHTHSGKAGFVGRIAAKLSGVPLILHTIHGPSFGPFQGTLANLMFTNAERFAGRFTDHFVVVANAMSELSLAAGIGQPKDYTRIFSGFDLGPFLEARRSESFRQKLGFSPDSIVIGKLARLTELKGHDDLLDAAPEILRRIPTAMFLFVGDGRWWDRLREKAAAMGLEKKVVFRGLIPPHEVPEHLAQMDLLVHLSRREGLARALPQAMAVRLPVVAYDCDGAREVCLDGRTGFLLKPGDIGGLAEALVRLAGSSQLRASLGANGRQLVQEWFPVETMVDSLAGLYEKLLRAKRQSPQGVSR